MIHFPSPKRSRSQKVGWEGFFPYYAGFPEAFANSVLSQIKLRSDAVVLDPWNGSGTTTYAAASLGYSSIGCDLNPTMVIIARARLLQKSEADTVEPLGEEILREALRGRTIQLEETDALLSFFGPETAKILRAIERSIRKHLVGNKTITSDGIYIENISSLAASNYVALFAVCRSLIKRFQSSNPTWLRWPGKDEARVGASSSTIATLYRNQLAEMAKALSAMGDHRAENTRFEVRLADTANTSFASDTVDLILTSPPYCTRIDYTSATRIELCVLEPLLAEPIRSLGAKMIGTTQICPANVKIKSEWGKTCNTLLSSIERHPSKASKSYYLKTHLDYFDKLYTSLANLVPALKPGGSAIFVVQDSFYKDVHNDLPTILTEMSLNNDLKLINRQDFYIRHSMAGVNPRSKAYGRKPGATESILWLGKT